MNNWEFNEICSALIAAYYKQMLLSHFWGFLVLPAPVRDASALLQPAEPSEALKVGEKLKHDSDGKHRKS